MRRFPRRTFFRGSPLRRRGHLSLCLTALAVGLSTSVPANAREDADPTLASNTVVSGSPGAHGLRVDLEAHSSLSLEDVRVERMGEGLMFLALLDSADRCASGIDCLAAVVVIANLEDVDVLDARTRDGGLDAGTYDLYVLADTDYAVRLAIGGDGGADQLFPVQPVDGLLRRVDERCVIVGDCSRMRGGGIARTLDEDAFVLSIAYAPGYRPVDFRPTQSCLYPSPFTPEESARPEDHPHGCDVIPEHRDTEDVVPVTMNDPLDFWVPNSLTMTGSFAPAGRATYAGTTVSSGWSGPGAMAGWAVWLTASLDP